MTKTCLLITDRLEATADLLVAEMRRRDMPCVRWNLDRYPLGSALNYRLSDEVDAIEIVSDGRRVDFDQVGSVWCRAFTPLAFPEDFNPADRKFAQVEAERALAGLLSRPDILWINHPQRYALANSKPAQLAMARRLGFAIPTTLISNDPDEVATFIDAAPGPVVYKCFSQALDVESGKGQFTGIVTARERANLDLIRATPGVFQHYVEKAYEVRITVVGGRVFAGRINSQDNADTKVDWRHRPFDMASEPHALPQPIARGVVAFLESFGLGYGAFDFIVAPDGTYVFLEVNPGGQYMWVEAATGMPITAALVDALCAPCRAG